ncbi:MAG TPA: YaeQ family protein [Planctomycetota bacterium]|nr:YaeQ family protein [Planctomycetota bacterium]
MALTATMHRFDIELADSDRGVYKTLELRVARHPSEGAAFLLARVLAYCIEYEEGIAFSKAGISSVEEPAISICDLTGARQAWIEVGAPSADRLHRASKATPRVALYTDRRLDLLRTSLAGERIHRADKIPVTVFPQAFLRSLEATLERNMRWSVSISDGHLYLTSGGVSFDTALEPQPLFEAS